MSEQVQFELNFKIEGKDTICGFREMDDDNGEKYFLLCATIGDYTKEYELRLERKDDGCHYHFVTPDVPAELVRHECEISDAIQDRYPNAL